MCTYSFTLHEAEISSGVAECSCCSSTEHPSSCRRRLLPLRDRHSRFRRSAAAILKEGPYSSTIRISISTVSDVLSWSASFPSLASPVSETRTMGRMAESLE